MTEHDPKSDHPLAQTRAAVMLTQGLKRVSDRDRVSQRQLAKRLGYKQSVMLSHWANGRVPIPVERVTELAEALELDERDFLLAVLSQRYPAIDWDILENQHNAAYNLVQNLQAIAGAPVEEFGVGQMKVMREAAADPQAQRRWLSIHEVALVEAIRDLRPGFVELGLDHTDLRRIKNALAHSE